MTTTPGEDAFATAHHEAAHPTRGWHPDGVPEVFQTAAWARARAQESGRSPTPGQVHDAVRGQQLRVSVLRVLSTRRRLVVTLSGLVTAPVGLGPGQIADQHAQVIELAGLAHVQVRVADEAWRNAHPEGFVLRGGRVFTDRGGGACSPAGIAAFDARFEDLWEGAEPFTDQMLSPR